MAINALTDRKWITEHFEKIKNKAGPRYTPELNVDLPISEIFDGISRTKIFYASSRSHLGELLREFSYVRIKPGKDPVSKAYRALKSEIYEFASLIQPIKEYDTKPIPWR